jgi:2-oxoglutarate dehydrogenase E2 component (dihydrolipoamide succinyltransferase)
MMDGDYKIAYDSVIFYRSIRTKGLMVPVVRNAENLTFRGVADIKRLAIRARDGQITLMI